MGPSDGDQVVALWKARNIYSHGFGRVRAWDTDQEGHLVLRWSGLEMWGVGSDSGTMTPLNALFGNELGEETTINIKKAWRERRWHVGDQLDLSTQDLWEICYFITAQVSSTVQSFRDWLAQEGIELASKDEVV